MAKVTGLVLLLGLCLHSSQGVSNWFFRRNTCNHLLGYGIAPINPNCYNNPNVKSDMSSMITRSNYKMEMHTVITSDGYILHIFRIPAKGKQPVYLQHGIATNGHVFVDKDERSLAFKLSEQGFDVWIGTVRGSTYGSKHLNLSRNDQEFWDFRLDDHVEKDLPATLGYVADVTGKAGEIIYIGHSMGTSIMFMFASSQPEEAQKLLKGVIAMSPVAYLDKNIFIKALSPFAGVIRSITKLIGVRALYKNDKAIQSTLNIACRYVPFICTGALDVIFGKDPKQFAAEDLLLYFSSWPVSASADEHIQFLQIANKERFQKFDYGSLNQEIYKQPFPPAYDLTKVTVPMFLFTGKNDAVCPLENVERLFFELGSKKKLLIQISKDGQTPFNHISFEYAKDAETLLYPELFKVINENLATNNSSESGEKPADSTTSGSTKPFSQTKPEGADDEPSDLPELKPAGGSDENDDSSEEEGGSSNSTQPFSQTKPEGADDEPSDLPELKPAGGSDENDDSSEEEEGSSNSTQPFSQTKPEGADDEPSDLPELKPAGGSDENDDNSDEEEGSSNSTQPFSQTKPEGAGDDSSDLPELKPAGEDGNAEGDEEDESQGSNDADAEDET